MCFAIRKKLFLDCKGFNTKIKSATAEDEEFGYNLIDKGNKILNNYLDFEKLSLLYEVDFYIRFKKT